MIKILTSFPVTSLPISPPQMWLCPSRYTTCILCSLQRFSESLWKTDIFFQNSKCNNSSLREYLASSRVLDGVPVAF